MRSAAASQAETIGTILSGQPIDIDVAESAAAPRTAAGARRRRRLAGRPRGGPQHPCPARSRDPRHRRGDRHPATSRSAPRHTVGRCVGQHQQPTCRPGCSTSCGSGRRRHQECGSRSANRRAASRDFAPAIVEALEAQRIARLAGRREGSITRYSDISLRALATANIDQARDFVARELGRAGVQRMKRPDGSPRRCAPTSTRTAAAAGPRRRLNVHENTVAYRLRQAEELLGKVGGQAHPRAARRTRPGRSRRRERLIRAEASE